MNENLKEFKTLLQTHDRLKCTNYIKDLINAGNNIFDIYTYILIPAMTDVGLPDENDEYDIVTEHIYSNIVRTIIENCSIDIKNSAKACNGKTILICGVEGEMHDLPPRIVEDYFILEGFNTIYLGSNTPISSVEKAIKKFSIDYVAISVTNFYFLSKLDSLSKVIKDVDKNIIVTIGGAAVNANMAYCKSLKYVDHILESIEQIKDLRGDEK